jgi:hypothetical protein
MDTKLEQDLALLRKLTEEAKQRDEEREEKDYYIEVNIVWGNATSGYDEAHAIANLKNTFYNEFGIELTDQEIVKVEER